MYSTNFYCIMFSSIYISVLYDSMLLSKFITKFLGISPDFKVLDASLGFELNLAIILSFIFMYLLYIGYKKLTD